jgi:hypothetical protein
MLQHKAVDGGPPWLIGPIARGQLLPEWPPRENASSGRNQGSKYCQNGKL